MEKLESLVDPIATLLGWDKPTSEDVVLESGSGLEVSRYAAAQVVTTETVVEGGISRSWD